MQVSDHQEVSDIGDQQSILKDFARRAFRTGNYQDAVKLYLDALQLLQATAPGNTSSAAAGAAAQHTEPAAAKAYTDSEDSSENSAINNAHPHGKSAAVATAAAETSGHRQQQPAAAAAAPCEVAIICSNISAALLKLHRPHEALEYATTAVQAAPNWSKALYRQANALMDLQQYKEAVPLLQKLIRQIDLGSSEAAAVNALLHKAVSESTAADHHDAIQSEIRSAHAAWVQTTAREASGCAALLHQLQQGTSGYAWDPQDWEWRPTWLPSFRSNLGLMGAPTAAAAAAAADTPGSSSSSSSDVQKTNATSKEVIASDHQVENTDCLLQDVAKSVVKGLSAAFSSQQQQQQYLKLLSDLTVRLADLESPQRGYQLLQDVQLLDWYQNNLAAAAAAKVAAGVQQMTVLVLANGSGVILGLLAAAAAAAAAGPGASYRVYVVEKNRWGYRAAKQLLDLNRQQLQQQQGLVQMIELVPVPLSRCYYMNPKQQQQQQGGVTQAAGVNGTIKQNATVQNAAAAGSSEGVALQQYQLQHQADIVVTDLFDYSVFGQGLLPSLSAAAAADLLSSDVLLLPDELVIHGQLNNTTNNTTHASGFNIQEINKYRWHPMIEKIDHDQLNSSCAAVSQPFTLLQLDLADYIKQQRSGGSSSSDGGHVHTSLQGSCDSILIWFDLINSNDQIKIGDISRRISTANISAQTHRSSSSSSLDDTPQRFSKTFGLGLYYLDAPMCSNSSSNVVLAAAIARSPTKQQQQQQYIKLAASVIEQQRLIVSLTTSSCSSGGSTTSSISSLQTPGISRPALSSTWSWSPVGLPRHAYLPRWHFDMLGDVIRNTAYDKAIRREVTRLRGLNLKRGPLLEDNGIHVLDIGTGTGLLAMMAARAGADAVTAVESVRHLAETATDIVALNDFDDRIKIVHKDGRYLQVGTKDGKADMARPADLLVFEVFDCGLIGEGALHIVAAAKSSLLRPGAKILPASAKVFCQPIQYQRQLPEHISNILNPAAVYPYSWQPDYFQVNLTSNPSPLQPSYNAAAHASNNSSTCGSGISSPRVQPPSNAAACPDWRPLAAPQLLFDFDFNTPDPLTAFGPSAKDLTFHIQQPGLLNAVAFWFELQLDDDSKLSSSPYVAAQQQGGPCSTTWKQAVQLLPEHAVSAGDQLTLIASHDTYAISFSLPATTNSNTAQPTPTTTTSNSPTPLADTQHPYETQSGSLTAPCSSSSSSAAARAHCDTTQCSSKADDSRTDATDSISNAAAAPSGVPSPTGVPLFDPLWRAAHDNLTQLQGHLVKSITQDPLEYRKCVTAAMLLAMWPWGTPAAPVEPPAGVVEGAAAAAADNITVPLEQQPCEDQTGVLKRSRSDHAAVDDGGVGAVTAPVSGVQAGACAALKDGLTWPAADPHHAAALLTRLMS